MAKKKAKNIVRLSVDSVQMINGIPVLKVQIYLPEIVLDGYRMKSSTKSLYLTFNLINTEEFIVFPDFTSLEYHVSKINIYGKEKLKKLTLGSIIVSSIPAVSRNILNGLVVKSCIDYILRRYGRDFDGFNIESIDSENEYEPDRSLDLISKFSDTVLKILEVGDDTI